MMPSEEFLGSVTFHAEVFLCCYFAKVLTKNSQKFYVTTETKVTLWCSLKSKTILHIHMLAVSSHFVLH